MEKSLKDKTAKGLLWGGISNGLIQVLGALFGIVLLRLLSPADYGKIAVLLVFMNIATSLQNSGFFAALINQKQPTREQYNSVFWFNITVSIIVYVILWFCAPLIADFYHEPILVQLSRYLFLSFVISALNMVPRCYMNINLMVKQSGIINMSALIISNIIGILLAYCGYAFWGLATQSIAYVSVITIMTWWYSGFRPSFQYFDMRPALKMFGFSSKILLNNLFGNVNAQVLSILLGRLYSTQTVGFYSNARKWNDMALQTISSTLEGVTHPVLAKVVGDNGRYKAVFRKMLRFICFVSFPCMFGLSLIADDFIKITVGAKWMESAGMLSLLCIYGAFAPVTFIYDKMTVSFGRSGIEMFCNISICLLTWIGLIVMSPYGIYYMILFFVAINILWLFVWQIVAYRLFRLTLLEAANDILPFLLLSLGVMAVTWFITSPIDNVYLSMIAKIAVAVILYIGATYLSGAVILRETISYLTHLHR